MKIPEQNRHWKIEVEESLGLAEKRAKREGLDIKYMYTYAVDYIVRNRGIDDEDLILEIKEDIEQRVKEDWEVDRNSQLNHKFYFVSSYLFGHVPAGLLEEKAGDRIMDYLNENMELFHPDYDFE